MKLVRTARGFILLEVLISVTIMAVGLVAVMNVFAMTLRANSLLQHRTLATQLAELKLWHLKDSVIRNGTIRTGREQGEFSDILYDIYGSADPTYDGFVWQTTIEHVPHPDMPEKFTPVILVDGNYYTAVPSSVYDITLEIYWGEVDDQNLLYKSKVRWRAPRINNF